MVAVPKKQTIFAQGDEADAVFYIQKGKVRLTVVSKTGKEATIGIVSEGNFFGEGAACVFFSDLVSDQGWFSIVLSEGAP